MIYAVIKFLIRITTWFYFKEAKTIGQENIPKDGPLVIVANHPCTFLDPILIAMTQKRQVYFLAKGAIFSNAVARWIYKQFNMIPVFRQQDDPGMMHKNLMTFEKCFEHLEKDGVLLLFPEGISVTEKKLKPIKTGAARIALGTEIRNQFKKNVKILPIGLNYEDPHSFRKNVLVNIGTPISVSEYKEQNETDEKGAVNKLTGDIKTILEDLSVDIQEKQQEQLVEKIHNLYNHNPDVKESFINEKTISEVVQHFAMHQRARFNSFYEKLNSFEYTKNILNINNDLRKPNQSNTNNSIWKKSIVVLIKLILILPIALFGFIHNFIPFFLAPWLTSKINNTYEYKGPISMTVAMFSYIILYSVLGVYFYKFTEIGWLTVIYVLSLPISGLLAFNSFSEFKELVYKYKLINLFFKKREMTTKLITQHQELLQEIEKAHEEYLALTK